MPATGHVLYHGTIAGLGAGTGAAFSLLPAQNATGNWIKIIQRVPVRIALDPREIAVHPLQIGLSMKADVDVQGGADGARMLPRLFAKPRVQFACYTRSGPARIASAPVIRSSISAVISSCLA